VIKSSSSLKSLEAIMNKTGFIVFDYELKLLDFD
jgi:hypothetical protein